MEKVNEYITLFNEIRSLIKTHYITWHQRSTDQNIPEEVLWKIRTALEQTELLAAKKFYLLERVLLKAGEQKNFTEYLNDLQKLWNSICRDVQDLLEQYRYLQILKENNWIKLTPKKEQKSLPAITSRDPVKTEPTEIHQVSTRSTTDNTSTRPINLSNTTKVELESTSEKQGVSAIKVSPTFWQQIHKELRVLKQIHDDMTAYWCSMENPKAQPLKERKYLSCKVQTQILVSIDRAIKSIKRGPFKTRIPIPTPTRSNTPRHPSPTGTPLKFNSKIPLLIRRYSSKQSKLNVPK